VGAAPRITVLIPCFNDGRNVAEAVESVQEAEPVEVVVIDDASTDEATRATLGELEARGAGVIRLAANGGVGKARMAGLAATSGRYVFPLDADDLAIAGVLGEMATRLDARPDAAACVGDVLEFGDHELLRSVPQRLDPYRVAYTNEYPISALFRRGVLDRVGGWRRAQPSLRHGYEDWNLWMSIAELELPIVHLGAGRPGYRRRLHGSRLNADAKGRHAALYHAMRDDHPQLFGRIREHRRRSDLSPLRRLLYPVVYGARAELPFERRLKPIADRMGIWTGASRSPAGGDRGTTLTP
jgi:glycosyltransferase involved in cell wall biosynthesis